MQMRALVGLCMWERHWHRMIENAEDNGELEDEGDVGCILTCLTGEIGQSGLRE